METDKDLICDSVKYYILIRRIHVSAHNSFTLMMRRMAEIMFMFHLSDICKIVEFYGVLYAVNFCYYCAQKRGELWSVMM